MARFSSRDTCTWLTPRMRAHCCWVMPLKNRRRMVCRSLSGSRSMAARRAMRSTMLSSVIGEARVDSKVSPSAFSCWRLSGGAEASSATAISSAVRPVASLSSESAGSRPSRVRSRSRAA